ncbi:MAG: Ig-like domain-containing protein, partial [Actinomycetota bacterium]
MLGFDWKKGLSRFVGASLVVVVLTVVGAVSPAHAAAPTVIGVGSPTTSGFYKVGSPVIEVRVQFSEIVNVTGIPTLQLETGTTDRVLNYATGSGTNRLTFNYTISSTDTSNDLDYLATTSLVLAGGSTIKNATNENAVLTLAAPGALGSFGANNAIVVDTTAPTASVATATVGSTSNAVAQSNELGTVFLVKSNNSPTSVNQIMALFANERSTGTTIATINTNTNVPAAMLVGGTYKIYAADAAGNLSAASTNTVTVDTVAPFVGMVPLNTPLGSASRISVQSSETGTAYLVRSTIAVTSKASITGAADADFNAVTIAAPNTNTSLATTTLTAGNFILYAVDAADNLSFPFSFPITIGIDSSAPTMLGVTPFSGDLEASISASIVARFNEPVAPFVVDGSKTITLARSIVPTITGAVLSGTVETITFSSNPGLVVTDKITIASCTAATLNGSAMAISAVSGLTVTFANTSGAVSNSPGSCAYTATKSDNTVLITVSEVIPSNDAKVTVGSFPNDDTVTINPAGVMLFGVSYYVLITAGAIVDKAGTPNNFMGIPSATPQFYSFTTGNDTTAPSLNVSQSDPPNGMTTFTPDRSITLKFSETVLAVANKFIKLCTGAVDCATPVETFTLETSTGTGVSVASSLVTINPTADLSFSTTYFLLIEGGAFKDGSDNNYAGLATCSSHPCGYEFTTMAVPVPGVTPVFVAPSGPVPTGPVPTGPCVSNCYVAPPAFLPGMIAVIIGPAPTFGANGVPLGLTAGNMAGVDPNAFRNFNPIDSRGLSNDAMSGFNSGQMAALPPSAMGGFNSSQMAALPPSAMGGFNSSQ